MDLLNPDEGQSGECLHEGKSSNTSQHTTTTRTTARSHISLRNQSSLPPRLIRPFALIIWFHEAVRINLDTLHKNLSQWRQTKEIAFTYQISAIFKTLARNIEIHSQHEVFGIYPELHNLISHNIRDKNYSAASRNQLIGASTEIEKLMNEHTKDSQTITRIKSDIAQFLKNTKTDSPESTDNNDDQTSLDQLLPNYRPPQPYNPNNRLTDIHGNRIEFSPEVPTNFNVVNANVLFVQSLLNPPEQTMELKLQNVESEPLPLKQGSLQTPKRPVMIKAKSNKVLPKNQKKKKKKLQNLEINEMFQTAANRISEWICTHSDHLDHEETFFKLYLMQLCEDEFDAIMISKGILDLNRELVIEHQFGFVLESLSKLKQWNCPLTDVTYLGNEILAAYIHCLQLLSDEEEYGLLLAEIDQYIQPQTWNDLKLLYRLDCAGLFEYRTSRVRLAKINVNVNEGCCEDTSCCTVM